VGNTRIRKGEKNDLKKEMKSLGAYKLEGGKGGKRIKPKAEWGAHSNRDLPEKSRAEMPTGRAGSPYSED